jgi:hypothetical protein
MAWRPSSVEDKKQYVLAMLLVRNLPTLGVFSDIAARWCNASMRPSVTNCAMLPAWKAKFRIAVLIRGATVSWTRAVVVVVSEASKVSATFIARWSVAMAVFVPNERLPMMIAASSAYFSRSCQYTLRKWWGG